MDRVVRRGRAAGAPAAHHTRKGSRARRKAATTRVSRREVLTTPPTPRKPSLPCVSGQSPRGDRDAMSPHPAPRPGARSNETDLRNRRHGLVGVEVGELAERDHERVGLVGGSRVRGEASRGKGLDVPADGRLDQPPGFRVLGEAGLVHETCGGAPSGHEGGVGGDQVPVTAREGHGAFVGAFGGSAWPPAGRHASTVALEGRLVSRACRGGGVSSWSETRTHARFARDALRLDAHRCAGHVCEVRLVAVRSVSVGGVGAEGVRSAHRLAEHPRRAATLAAHRARRGVTT